MNLYLDYINNLINKCIYNGLIIIKILFNKIYVFLFRSFGKESNKHKKFF